MNREGEPSEETGSDIDLRYYLQVLLRRRWIILAATLASVLGTALSVYRARPVYFATTLVLIEKEQGATDYSEAKMVETSADDYYQTQFRLLTSRSLLKKVHAELGLQKTEEFRSLGALARAVSVTPIRRSRLLNVNAESFDPELAAKIANTLSELYVKENIEGKLFISREILRALFPEKAAELPATGGPPTVDYEFLPPVVNSGLIQTLKSQYAELETKQGDLSNRYTAEHPKLLRLQSQMRALRQRIEHETLKVVAGMKAELSGKLLGNNVRIVDPAEVPGSPSKPRKQRAIAMAAFLGLLAGYLLALGIDMLDQTLHSQEDVERKLQLPFLGSIPMAALDSDSAQDYNKLLKGPKSFTGESLKNIRTMVGFAAAGKPMKSILLTSTGQGEGKTFIAISLSMVFAQLGERVLLIEGDLRRPSLHKRFALSKEKGVSHFLAHGEQAGELSALVQTPKALENLDILVCGHIPPNPAELLSTPRISGLMDWAVRSYDRIIIDGTPIFPITDALLWARHCDSAIFVVKFGGTNGNLAARATQKLADSGLKIAGAVVNQVTARSNSYYGDYYYYYYYYHSDYVDSPEKEKKAARQA